MLIKDWYGDIEASTDVDLVKHKICRISHKEEVHTCKFDMTYMRPLSDYRSGRLGLNTIDDIWGDNNDGSGSYIEIPLPKTITDATIEYMVNLLILSIIEEDGL